MSTVEQHIDDAIALLEVDRLEQAFQLRMCEGSADGTITCRQEAKWVLTLAPCNCEIAQCNEHREVAYEDLRYLHAQPWDAITHKPCGQRMQAVDVDITAKPI